jgi:uncharacterized membrane protein (UPF0127 family)
MATAAAAVRVYHPRPVPGTLMLLNQATREPVATRVEIAATRRTRRRGLLGRARLEPGAALVLAPCVAVHTAFMQFAIDVAFVTRAGRVVHAVERMPPWRMAMAPGAYAVIEMAAGSLMRGDLRVGDTVALVRTGAGGADETFDFEQVSACQDGGAR